MRAASKMRCTIKQMHDRRWVFAMLRAQETPAMTCQACKKPLRHRHFLNATRCSLANAMMRTRRTRASKSALRGLWVAKSGNEKIFEENSESAPIGAREPVATPNRAVRIRMW